MPSQKILYGVLNWGLGHATRSLPIIHELIRRGNQLTIASDGGVLDFLKKELPDLEFLRLPGYNIHYSTSSALLATIQNTPNLFLAIRKEQQVVKNWLKLNKVDLIISDCRFGCYQENTRSILINHNLKVPGKSILAASFAIGMKKIISKFDECWVPDVPNQALSGELSEVQLKIPKNFIGYLSTMCENVDQPEYNSINYDAIAIISGPEPARSKFENKVLEQLSNLNGKYLVVGGRIETNERNSIPENIEYIKLVGRQKMNKLINQSEMVICRTGYSSLLDLLKVRKKALLIPTPGQPEQEYLGIHLTNENWCVVQSQKALNLEKGLQELNLKSRPITPKKDFDIFKEYL